MRPYSLFQFRSTEFGFETRNNVRTSITIIAFQFRSTEFGFETEKRDTIMVYPSNDCFNSVLRNLVLRLQHCPHLQTGLSTRFNSVLRNLVLRLEQIRSAAENEVKRVSIPFYGIWF